MITTCQAEPRGFSESTCQTITAESPLSLSGNNQGEWATAPLGPAAITSVFLLIMMSWSILAKQPNHASFMLTKWTCLRESCSNNLSRCGTVSLLAPRLDQPTFSLYDTKPFTSIESSDKNGLNMSSRGFNKAGCNTGLACTSTSWKLCSLEIMWVCNTLA